MNILSKKVTPVILVGGSGQRLWPLSSKDRPKPFAPLIKGAAPLATTLKRIDNQDLFNPPILVANHAHRTLLESMLEDFSSSPHVILEPFGRDSAPAIAAALCYIEQQTLGDMADQLVIVMPSDHIISDNKAFERHVRSAAEIALQNHIVTFAMKADTASTAYGYIRPGAPIDREHGAFHIGAFVEKPNAERAQAYKEQGYRWNSGNFLFSAGLMRAEMHQFCPNIWKSAAAAIAKGKRSGDRLTWLDEVSFQQAEKISIDYALMEKTQHAALIKADFDWMDIGSWDSIWEISNKDIHQNSLSGPSIVFQSEGSLAFSDGPLLCLAGCRDMIAVAHDNKILIVPRSKAQIIKPVVTEIENTENPSTPPASDGSSTKAPHKSKDGSTEAPLPAAFVSHRLLPGQSCDVKALMGDAAFLSILTGAVWLEGKKAQQHFPSPQMAHVDFAVFSHITNRDDSPAHLLVIPRR